jgi:signal transduction histidine kinase
MVETDPTLVLRVLGNMIVNALEATGPGGAVRLSIEENPEWVTFSVWNDATIPSAIRNRIFQRNVSTKDDMGRGLGTYSMKLFGEQVLGGRVSFTSDASGTVFRFSLPAVSGR